MSDDQKAEAAAPSLDARAAEVLRFLDRAKGTIAKRHPDLTVEATAESLNSTARVLGACGRSGRREASGPPARPGRRRQGASRVSRPARTSGGRPCRLAQLVDEAGGDLGRSAHTGPCGRDRPRLAAHTLAQSTHDVLQQILENQTKAQAAKGGKRR